MNAGDYQSGDVISHGFNESIGKNVTMAVGNLLAYGNDVVLYVIHSQKGDF